MIDKIKLALAALILIGGVYGYYQLPVWMGLDVSILLRVGLVLVSIIAAVTLIDTILSTVGINDCKVILYTDSETYFGKIHPFEALKKYRKEMNLPESKLVVVGMQSNGFTIADPNDPGMLDVVGFDSATPEIITNFSAGKI